MALEPLIDAAPRDVLKAVIHGSIKEKGRRLLIHRLHRWWSRRFSSIYRFLLAGFLSDDPAFVREAIGTPYIMRDRAKNKVFFEPFAGGGTGLLEAIIAGWNVIGVDLNPIAVRICKTELSLVTRGTPRDYENIVLKALDESLYELKHLWLYEDYIVVYTFLTRGKIPTWLTTYSERGRRVAVSICPSCFEINYNTLPSVGNGKARCKKCGKTYTLSIRGEIDLPRKNLPQINDTWFVYAIELRRKTSRRDRLWINMLHCNELQGFCTWFSNSLKIANEYAKKIISFLKEIDIEELTEAKRMRREVNITGLHELFTPKQLASFFKFAKKIKEYLHKSSEDELSRLIYGILMSESAKVANLAARWHPPIGEPIPAASMKTYWIPEHVVEVNPLAHIPGTLKTMGRDTIASIASTHMKIFNKIQKLQERGDCFRSNQWLVIQEDAANYVPQQKVDLVVLDPPYLGSVKSYASLSIVHYAALSIYDYVLNAKNQAIYRFSLSKIEKREITASEQEYEKKLTTILMNIVKYLKKTSRVVLIYNKASYGKWLPPLRAFKKASLNPLSAYWVLGESPGSLGRSKLKGIFLIIFKNKEKNKTPRQVRIVFHDSIKEALKYMTLDLTLEEKAKNALIKALETIFNVKCYEY